MGKKLAIKGHFTRGKEVIELLEMMGGVNGKINKKTGETYNIYNGDYFIHEICDSREVAYYIDFESQIRCIDIKCLTTDFIVYSFERFLEEYPYKVGDKVLISGLYYGTISKITWDSINNNIFYYVKVDNFHISTDVNSLKPYKEEKTSHPHVNYDITTTNEQETPIDFIKETDDRYRIVLNYQYDMIVDEGEYYAVKRKSMRK